MHSGMPKVVTIVLFMQYNNKKFFFCIFVKNVTIQMSQTFIVIRGEHFNENMKHATESYAQEFPLFNVIYIIMLVVPRLVLYPILRHVLETMA